MERSKFNIIVRERINSINTSLIVKGNEYAPQGDRLGNFKCGGVFNHETPERYLLGLVSKHIIALRDFIYELDTGGTTRDKPQWNEKIGDIINYMILLEGLLADRSLNANNE